MTRLLLVGPSPDMQQLTDSNRNREVTRISKSKRLEILKTRDTKHYPSIAYSVQSTLREIQRELEYIPLILLPQTPLTKKSRRVQLFLDSQAFPMSILSRTIFNFTMILKKPYTKGSVIAARSFLFSLLKPSKGMCLLLKDFLWFLYLDFSWRR